jgi:hypothetical protein
MLLIKAATQKDIDLLNFNTNSLILNLPTYNDGVIMYIYMLY